MRLMTLQSCIFSIKTFGAAILALFAGLSLDFSRPYWSVVTVYIVSNPLSGATRSKAAYRVFGTLIGSAAALFMVPNLVNAPELLVLAMTLWCVCCLYISQLDPTPRSYIFMLAGYTAALIGFPAVNTPEQMWDIALARTEEIILGIACAALVSSLVFPRRAGEAVTGKVSNWLSHTDISASDALQLQAGPESDARRLRLAADVAEIENLATHLAYDEWTGSHVGQWLRQIEPRMLLLLPVLQSVSDGLREAHHLGGLSKPVAALVGRLQKWLKPGQPHLETDLTAIHDAIEDKITHPLHRTWHDLVELQVLTGLRDFVNIRADCIDLSKAAETGAASLAGPLRYDADELFVRVRHYDYVIPLMTSLVVGLSILIACAFWIVLGWPEGSSAAMIAAALGSIAASTDNAAKSMASMVTAVSIAIAVAGLYLFAILPYVHNFETLILVFAPVYLAYGLFLASPRLARLGLLLAVMTMMTMALQEMYSADPATFSNSGMAIVLGVVLAAETSALLLMPGAEWRVLRLGRANDATLAEAANAATPNEDARVAGILFERLLIAAPRAAAAGRRMPDVLGQVMAGFSILGLHHAQRSLTGPARNEMDTLMRKLVEYYQSSRTSPGRELLSAMDRAIYALAGERSGEALDALLGLVELRRLLFPNQGAPGWPKFKKGFPSSQIEEVA